MKLKQITPWMTSRNMSRLIKSQTIKSWLLEKGPITKRISKNYEFELNLLKDDIASINQEERDFLCHDDRDIKVREVILLADRSPLVYAKSLIPSATIKHGFAELGKLGRKPLGDILFEKEIFFKTNVMYAEFLYNENIFWGRKTRYLVKELPLSVMEVFLLDEK